jgi:hypothetical protein
VGETEKKVRRERRTLVFMDESGFYLLPAVVRTYAPCGQTPVLRPFLTRAHLSVMGAVTPTGGLYTLVREAALRGKESGQFLQHLRRHVAEMVPRSIGRLRSSPSWPMAVLKLSTWNLCPAMPQS